jgi:hypothetical protein
MDEVAPGCGLDGVVAGDALAGDLVDVGVPRSVAPVAVAVADQREAEDLGRRAVQVISALSSAAPAGTSIGRSYCWKPSKIGGVR